jgi:hypothetical protein
MALEKLCKVTSKNKIIYWQISIITEEDKWFLEYFSYYDKIPEIKSRKEIIGKNIGKKNETSKEEQAKKELLSKVKSKIKTGYNRLDGKEIVVENNISDFKCMLLNKPKFKENWITLGCFIQPKLDGLRCFAIYREKWTLVSRKGHEFMFLDHIKKELTRNFNKEHIYDGELIYNQKSLETPRIRTSDFQNLTGIVSVLSKTKSEFEEDVDYHIFDIANLTSVLHERLTILYSFMGNPLKYINLVKSVEVDSWENILILHKEYADEGYEGSVIKYKNCLYENKRSLYCLKIKDCDTTEYQVVDFRDGVEPGKVIWTCETSEGKRFDCVPKTTDSKKEEYFKKGKEYIGKFLTVQHQKLTKDLLPRFPVGLNFREENEGA